MRSLQTTSRGTFYLKGFYNDFCRCMVYGEGFPPGTTITAFGTRVSVTYFSGALDIVGHELTHAVTFATSRLTYLNESGALNEAFSDIMGTSIEFFYQPAGTGPLKADYLVGEDIISPLAPSMGRSLATPADYLQPDHYALRAAIGNSFDNGGVHINSGIANHARSTWPSREEGTAYQAVPYRASAPRPASKSRRCSIGPSPRCCPRTPRCTSRGLPRSNPLAIYTVPAARPSEP